MSLRYFFLEFSTASLPRVTPRPPFAIARLLLSVQPADPDRRHRNDGVLFVIVRSSVDAATSLTVDA